MIKKTLTLIAALAAALTAFAQVKVSVHETAKDQPVIPAEIYGQFSEHLGKCIYEGIWVGKDSSIPNVNGYRTDVLEAFKALKVPYSAGRAAASATSTTGWTASARRRTARSS